MDDPRIRMMEELMAEFFYQTAVIEARATALREALARVQARLDGDTPEAIELRLIAAEKRHLDQALLEFEKKNPHWAAMMDRRDVSDLPDGDGDSLDAPEDPQP